MLDIIVNGRKIDQYKHDNLTFVEGRKGSNYEIQFYNNRNARRKIVISVDGLNIISGDKNWSKGYIVGPYETLKIPGWLKDSKNAAKFVFSSVGKSYNNKNDNGETENVGVIGAMCYDEEPVNKYWYINQQPVNKYWYINQQPNQWYTTDTVWYDTPVTGRVVTDTIPLSGSSGGRGIGTSATSGVFRNASASASMNAAYTSSMNAAERRVNLDAKNVKTEVSQSIGTGWGNNKSFETTSVDFNSRSYVSEVFTVYYDDRKGLINRGIEMKPWRKPKANPNPFPGFSGYCPAPK